MPLRLPARAPALTRAVHIQSAPTSSPIPPKPEHPLPPSPPELTNPQPLFSTLGQPARLLQVALTPSLPVYIKSNSLLSLAPISINSSPYWLHPFKRVLLGFHSFKYQKLESTVPGTALVRSNDGLYVLNLDGKQDYALFAKDSLFAFSGPALRLETHRTPRTRISKSSWLGRKIEKVGMGLGYTLIQGRGDAVLKGLGEVYKLDLAQDEEIVVKKSGIVGLSLTEKLDCIVETNLGQHHQDQTKNADEEITEEMASVTPITEITTANESLKFIKSYWTVAKKYLSKGITAIWSILPGEGYVKVSGPRTLLLQSGVSTIFNKSSSILPANNQKISIVENKINDKLSSSDPQDYLSYVTVKNGEVSFQSTPDFKASVDKQTPPSTNP